MSEQRSTAGASLLQDLFLNTVGQCFTPALVPLTLSFNKLRRSLALYRHLVLASLAIGSSCAFVQANAVDAAVNGYVTDSSKSAIPGAHVSLTNVGTGISREAVADDKGYYRFPLVPVGTYRLLTTATGFEQTTQAGIVLSVGQEARIDAALPVGSTNETVEVQANASLMDSGTSTVGAVFAALDLLELGEQEAPRVKLATAAR